MSNSKTVPPHALLSWECGGGSGHISELQVVAKALRERGWRVSCLARYPVAVYRKFGEILEQVFQAPVLRPIEDTGLQQHRPSVDFADILAFAGFADIDSLNCQLQQLNSILAQIKPDLIVADFAPATCLAGRGRIPIIRIGASFYLPPSTIAKYPRLRKQGERVIDAAKVLQTVRKACRQSGLASPKSLPQAVGGNCDIVACHSAFDIYSKLRPQPANGPLEPFPEPLPEAQVNSIFFYLSGEYPPNEKILEALIATGIPLRGYLRGPTARQRQLCSAAGIFYSDKPLDIKQALDSAAVVVHNGGINFMQEIVAAARYQIVFPRHLEQQLNAARLKRLNIGTEISPHGEIVQITRRIKEVFAARPEYADLHSAAVKLQLPRESLSQLLNAVDRLTGAG